MTATARAKWLKERKKGLGGSDAPVVMGLSNFKSRYTLWAEKVGLVDEVDLSDKEFVQWGQRLERPILDAYTEESGRKIKYIPLYTLYWDNDIPYMFCTPDAMQVGDTPILDDGVVEVKNVNAHMGKEWEAEPPEQYQIQLLHNMCVLNVTWGTLVALIGGNRLVWYDYNYGDVVETIKDILGAEGEFWKLVETETPPEIDSSESTKKTLNTIGGEEEGKSIILAAESCGITDDLDALAEAIKKNKTLDAKLKNDIRLEMGANTRATLPDGSGWTYKANKAGSRILRRFF